MSLEQPASKTLLAQALEEVARTEAQWRSFDIRPGKPGYYFVRDCDGKDGVAFMNRNRTWSAIDNVKKPFSVWRDIP